MVFEEKRWDEMKKEVGSRVIIIREGEGDLCGEDRRGAQQTSGPLGFP